MEKIGLVLSGGGAKGAYEIGVWKALEKMGVTERIDKIVGTSVGALNAVLLDACGIDKAEEIWKNLKQDDLLHWGIKKDFSDATGEFDPKKIIEISEVVFFILVSIFGKGFVNKRVVVGTVTHMLESRMILDVVANPNRYPYLIRIIGYLLQLLINYGPPIDQQKLAELMENNINFEFVKREIYIMASEVCFPIRFCPRVFRLNDYIYTNSAKCRKILLASSATPIYEGIRGIKIDGSRYVDAGVFSGNKANTPISYARDDFMWKRTITVWLNHRAEENAYSKTNVDIIPSKPLGGCLKIDSKKNKDNMEMGESDTMKKESEIRRLLYC